MTRRRRCGVVPRPRSSDQSDSLTRVQGIGGRRTSLAMLFNSLSFLVFFPLTTLIYFLLPHRWRWAHLLACSAVFYAAYQDKPTWAFQPATEVSEAGKSGCCVRVCKRPTDAVKLGR